MTKTILFISPTGTQDNGAEISIVNLMNSLVKKGYVKRERGEEDRRVVYISLSDKGKKAFVHHARFHKEMITSIMDEFDDDEKKILIRGLTKLDNWFKNKEEENKKNRE